jgi:hypothetical protein
MDIGDPGHNFKKTGRFRQQLHRARFLNKRAMPQPGLPSSRGRESTGQ